MAINQELWTRDFAANLYDEKDFYRIGKNWSSFVNSAIVHIPQALSNVLPQAITGATSLPLAPAKVTYDDLTFTNKMLVSPPSYVHNIDASEASFDTRSEEMKDIVSKLRQAISIEVMNGWSTAATSSVIRTTGTTTRTNIYGQASMKALTFQDILNARTQIVRQNGNIDELYLIIDPVMYSDLIAAEILLSSEMLTKEGFVDGFVGTVAGMKVIQRSLGNPFTSAVAKPGTLLYDDSYDNTHFSGALIVDASKVGFAIGTMENGEIKMGVEPYATGFYTDVLQGHTRVGASKLYKEVSNVTKGVVAIVEVA